MGGESVRPGWTQRAWPPASNQYTVDTKAVMKTVLTDLKSFSGVECRNPSVQDGYPAQGPCAHLARGSSSGRVPPGIRPGRMPATSSLAEIHDTLGGNTGVGALVYVLDGQLEQRCLHLNREQASDAVRPSRTDTSGRAGHLSPNAPGRAASSHCVSVQDGHFETRHGHSSERPSCAESHSPIRDVSLCIRPGRTPRDGIVS